MGGDIVTFAFGLGVSPVSTPQKCASEKTVTSSSSPFASACAANASAHGIVSDASHSHTPRLAGVPGG